jgi:hypothetical protein
MTLSLDGASEESYARNPHRCVIECLSATWTYRYCARYMVILRGKMTAHVVVSQPAPSSPDLASPFPDEQRHLKIENLQFDADQQDKVFLVDTTMPMSSYFGDISE